MKALEFNVRQVAGEIAFDFETYKAVLEKNLAEYDNALFTEESKACARANLASLRKAKKDVMDTCKEIKAEWLKPYTEFEAKVKDLVACIDKPINLIDGQIKEMEEQRIASKKKEIEETYNNCVGDMVDYLPLARIYSKSWENATTKMSAIKKEMEEAANKAREAVATISGMESDSVPKALELYKMTLNLPEAISYVSKYEAQRMEILNREREESIARIRTEERERVAVEASIREETKKQTIETLKSVDEAAAAPLSSRESKKVLYTVVATEEELSEIEMAFNSLGIYFERKDA